MALKCYTCIWKVTWEWHWCISKVRLFACRNRKNEDVIEWSMLVWSCLATVQVGVNLDASLQVIKFVLADFAGHSGVAEWMQCEGSCSSWGLHNLLVSKVLGTTHSTGILYLSLKTIAWMALCIGVCVECRKSGIAPVYKPHPLIFLKILILSHIGRTGL